MNTDLLKKEISYIKDETLKNEIISIIANIPEVMEHKPSSSSGKYHPEFDRVDGGNINHTKAVVAVAKTLIDGLSDWDRTMYNINDDWIFAACILHDMMKYGKDPEHAEHTTTDHPILAGDLIRAKYPMIAFLIDSHMGKWNTIKKDGQAVGYMPVPISFMQKLVHIADHIASQTWISDSILK